MKNAPFVRFLSITLTLSISLPAAYAHDPVYARKGIVVAQEPVAADVGVAVMKSGGNAVDAGVAVGFALAVTHPFAGNIGGGGFMLIRLADGRTTFIDFREKAPHQATHDMYLDPSGNVTHDRSEEHTSELQSPDHLVCRLLLEKKKTKKMTE